MKSSKLNIYFVLATFFINACKVPQLDVLPVIKKMPTNYPNSSISKNNDVDSTSFSNIINENKIITEPKSLKQKVKNYFTSMHKSQINDSSLNAYQMASSNVDSNGAQNLLRQVFFTDKYLSNLIDTAISNNQELKIAKQEIEIAKNEIRIRHSQLLPKAELGGGMGIDKVARYTSQGAGDASTEIKPGKEVPEWLPDFKTVAVTSWELDIWKKIRNSRQAATERYLSTIEGRNFAITNIVGEIANNYYELLALDNEQRIVRQTITLQKNVLDIVKIQKEAAAATELAVKKFEAEVYKSESIQYDIAQQINEKENTINLLIGRYPQHIERDSSALLNIPLQILNTGLPSQLLANRPDIIEAEHNLKAAQLNVQVARAEFYPQFNLSSALGLQAFNPAYFIKMPQSLVFNIMGDLAGPLINKQAIKAEFNITNAQQLQALYDYERCLVNSYIEVNTQIGNIQNFEKKYEYKNQQVETLVKAISISNDLYKANRADYIEVLLNQRDAFEARMELIETRLSQFNSLINMYKALGGGWR